MQVHVVAGLPFVPAHVVVGRLFAPVHVAAAQPFAQVHAVAQHVVVEPVVARAVAPRAVALHVAVQLCSAVRHVALAQFFVAAWHVLRPQNVPLFAPAPPAGYALAVLRLIFQHVRRWLVL